MRQKMLRRIQIRTSQTTINNGRMVRIISASSRRRPLFVKDGVREEMLIHVAPIKFLIQPPPASSSGASMAQTFPILIVNTVGSLAGERHGFPPPNHRRARVIDGPPNRTANVQSSLRSNPVVKGAPVADNPKSGRGGLDSLALASPSLDIPQTPLLDT